jgi:hypothetical protein
MKIAFFSVVLSLLISLSGILLAAAIVGGIGFYLYRRHRMGKAAREAAQGWTEGTGVVLSSGIKVQRTGHSRSEVPVVVYQYQVDGRPYVGSVVKAGDQYFSVRFAGDARRTVERYPAGAQVTVFYNPADPAQSALER